MENQLSLLDQIPADDKVPLFESPMNEQDWKRKRGMKLLTAELLTKLPPLRGQEKAGDEAIVWVKWFTPDSSWTWYVTEFNPETGECFGLVDGFEKELGYFSLPEIMEVRGPLGLAVERDKFWEPTTLRKVMDGD